MTIEEAAKALGINFTTVWRWIKNGKLKASIVNGRWYIEEKEIARIKKESTYNARGAEPFGFKRVGRSLQKDPQEWPVVEQIFRLRKNGWSLQRIAEYLNEQGIRTKKGKKWYSATVRSVLINPLCHKYL